MVPTALACPWVDSGNTMQEDSAVPNSTSSTTPPNSPATSAADRYQPVSPRYTRHIDAAIRAIIRAEIKDAR